ncbi:hypothetical protein [Streptomyces sp. KN37]|uniref:hypothetical protein n=1 Tax=Streptomyces sp. KN37 TaxID=3090667 RepID=UPI002A758182|nr:hypothetical protein [Streptomyces sp. KN37]WPO69570.1 hypothetical protein R9806_02445 [Streptomyces sp. KN37]
MGYLRKNSFLIFEDKDAPKAKELTPQQITEIEAAHQEGKKGRVDELIRQELGIFIPKVSKTAAEKLADQGVDVSGLSPEGLAARAQMLGIRDDSPVVTEADVKAAQEAAKKREASPEAQRLRQIVQIVQDLGADQDALNEYLRNTFRATSEWTWREFARSVFEIETSKATLPDARYVPYRTPEATVRFKDGGGLGINEVASGKKWDSDKGEFVDRTDTEFVHAQGATLWVKVIDGWEKDGNWGGHLQVTCATAKGQWIESKNGWVSAYASKGDPVTFYDMGNHYEIWQQTRETGRPLVVEGDRLRFVAGATPGKFNLQNSTWD